MQRKGFSYYAFRVTAWLMLACITAQTFIAGLAVFSNPAQWRTHVVFVHIFEYLPIFMLIFAFAGRLPNRVKWMSAALFALIFLQYFTANMPGAGALHPVIALVMFWLAFTLVKETRHGGGMNGTAKEKDMEEKGRKKPMNIVVLILLSLFGGLFAGFLLSQIIGVLGHLVFGFPEWVKWVRYLPFLTGAFCAVVVPIWAELKGRTS
jgi:hypothetical protein